MYQIGDAVRLSAIGKGHMGGYTGWADQVRPSPDDIGWVLDISGTAGTILVRFASGAHNGNGKGWIFAPDELEKLHD